MSSLRSKEAQPARESARLGGHFIEYAIECGHVVAQCRCPSPTKEVRHRAGLCGECAAGIAVGADRHSDHVAVRCHLCGRYQRVEITRHANGFSLAFAHACTLHPR